MNKTLPIATFRTGAAGARFVICLSAAMDAFDPTEPYSRIYFFNQKAQNLWTFNEHDFVIPSVCVWRAPNTNQRIFVALSENGQVVFLGPNQVQEQIHEAGLHHTRSKGFGYLNDIQQIGEYLYACGFSGQVYRRIGEHNWVHMDEGILQQPGMNGGEYFVQVINGFSAQGIYIAGSENLRGYPPRADFWNGKQWSRLNLPKSAGRITNIFVESEEKIWMCGSKGTILLGNAHDGFLNLNEFEQNYLFLSICKFKEKIYLGSNLGLFTFNPIDFSEGINKVHTAMKPELQDANVVESVDDVLWSIGPKDIARFDGIKWERFHHPDNPPII